MGGSRKPDSVAQPGRRFPADSGASGRSSARFGRRSCVWPRRAGPGCDQPEVFSREDGVSRPPGRRRAASNFLFDLAPDGVARRPASRRNPVVSYTTFSPYPKQALARRFGRLFSVALSVPFGMAKGLPRSERGTSCPVESGLSSPNPPRGRPGANRPPHPSLSKNHGPLYRFSASCTRCGRSTSTGSGTVPCPHPARPAAAGPCGSRRTCRVRCRRWRNRSRGS